MKINGNSLKTQVDNEQRRQKKKERELEEVENRKLRARIRKEKPFAKEWVEKNLKKLIKKGIKYNQSFIRISYHDFKGDWNLKISVDSVFEALQEVEGITVIWGVGEEYPSDEYMQTFEYCEVRW